MLVYNEQVNFMIFSSHSRQITEHYLSTDHNHFLSKLPKNLSQSELNILILAYVIEKGPVPVAGPSKAWVCGRSLPGIAGSNPAGSMNACLL
jgi:hypothetical protein